MSLRLLRALQILRLTMVQMTPALALRALRKSFGRPAVDGLDLTVRPGARYFHSLRLLQRVKELDPAIFTKFAISAMRRSTRSGR